jgi:hypothetical protein
MKKEMGILFLLGILLISPLVLTQEQIKTQNEEQEKIYSGFDRFTDNVKMFFSYGDKKVMLASKIREKEVNSAIINTKNGDDEAAEENLKRARKRLQFIQEKVSKDIAEEVKTNVNQTIYRINKEENLSDDFIIYVLEEEKTQLVAELVVEIEGKEGQNLTREIVKDETTGEKKVEVIFGEEENIVKKDNATNEVENVVEGEDTGGEVEIVVSDEESKAEELEKRIGEIDEEIVKWVIKKGDNTVDESPKTKDNEDVAPKPNIVDDDVAPGPQGIVGDQGYTDDEGHTGDIPDDTSGASGEIDED